MVDFLFFWGGGGGGGGCLLVPMTRAHVISTPSGERDVAIEGVKEVLKDANVTIVGMTLVVHCVYDTVTNASLLKPNSTTTLFLRLLSLLRW